MVMKIVANVNGCKSVVEIWLVLGSVLEINYGISVKLRGGFGSCVFACVRLANRYFSKF